MTPGIAVHQYALAMLWNDVEDHPPALTVQIGRPGIVGHYHVPVARVTARSHEGAAIAGAHQTGCIRYFILRVVPGNIVFGKFLEGV